MSNNYKPGQVVQSRKTKFEKLNRWATERGAWIVSVPGADTVLIECLPGSTVPIELRASGYDVRPAEHPAGQRILASAIVQDFTLTSSDAYELATPGSTKPIAQVLRHAGICRVMRYTFTME
jgi:hypothetical protein